MPIISTLSVGIGTRIQSGTSGSVLFVSSTGNIAQDNGNLNYNDTLNTLNVNNIYGSGTSTLNSVSIGTSGIIPLTNNNKDLGSAGFRFANIWATTISGVNLNSSTANTPATANNSAALATTAFVQANLAAYVPMTSGANFASLSLANTFTNFNTFRDVRFSANDTYYIGTTASRPSGIFVGSSGINSNGPVVFPTPSGAASNTLGATTDFVKTVISGARTGSIGFGFPSGTFIAGATSLSMLIPNGRTIRGITILGEGSGSCAIDIRRISYGSYPMGSANTIFTGSNRATIISGVKSRDTSLTGLISTTLNRFDTVQAAVTSVTGLTGGTVILDTLVE